MCSWKTYKTNKHCLSVLVVARGAPRLDLDSFVIQEEKLGAGFQFGWREKNWRTPPHVSVRFEVSQVFRGS